jgi:hypothetical protein
MSAKPVLENVLPGEEQLAPPAPGMVPVRGSNGDCIGWRQPNRQPADEPNVSWKRSGTPADSRYHTGGMYLPALLRDKRT